MASPRPDSSRKWGPNTYLWSYWSVEFACSYCVKVLITNLKGLKERTRIISQGPLGQESGHRLGVLCSGSATKAEATVPCKAQEVLFCAHAVSEHLFLVDLRPLAPGGCLQCPDVWLLSSDPVPANAPHNFNPASEGYSSTSSLFAWFYMM